MLWLEMTRTEEHGGPGWALGERVWCPARKKNGAKWAHWETVLRVKRGDVIIHLQGKTGKQVFIGYSVAANDGRETKDRPPAPGEWGYAERFYYVPLTDYVAFQSPIKLSELLSQKEGVLRKYFKQKNKEERLFLVEQGGRIQCFNGGYFSEVTDDLASIIFGADFTGDRSRQRNPAISVETGEQLAQIQGRIGQSGFSDNVKTNYGNRCCFPGCDVEDSEFLIGAHIARWADKAEFRGMTSNGLCLCLHHDKAFEIGLFTLTKDYKIWINDKELRGGKWAAKNLEPFNNQRIVLGAIKPSLIALESHWQRIRCKPD